MVSRAVFGVVYFPKSSPFLDERILAVYEHQGNFWALPPGGRLSREENRLYETADERMRKEILVSALRREIGEELSEFFEFRVDPSKMYAIEDSVAGHDGTTLSGEVYFMRTEILGEDPLHLPSLLISICKLPPVYLNKTQLQEQARLKSFGKVLSDSSIREKLGL